MISTIAGAQRALPGLLPALPDGLPGLSAADEPDPSAPQVEQGPSNAQVEQEPPDSGVRKTGAGEQEPAGAGPRGNDAGEPEPIGNQPAIWDAEPEPRQLALLPEPAPWEADRPAPAGAAGARGGRLARRRSRAAPPDQLSLF